MIIIIISANQTHLSGPCHRHGLTFPVPPLIFLTKDRRLAFSESSRVKQMVQDENDLRKTPREQSGTSSPRLVGVWRGQPFRPADKIRNEESKKQRRDEYPK